MDGYIICDGSFHKQTRIAGVCGYMSINNRDLERYSYVLTEVISPTEAELYAIQMMATTMYQSLKGSKLDKLDIHTDSEDAISLINGDNFSDKHKHTRVINLASDINELLLAICPSGNYKVNWVKGKVNGDIANKHESLHNKSDEGARTSLRKLRDPIFYHDNHIKNRKSDTCVLSIDNDLIDKHPVKLINVVEALSKSSFNIRFLETNNDSFNKLVKKAFEAHSVSNSIHFYKKSNAVYHEINPDPTYANGLDRAILRNYLLSRNKDHDSFINNSSSEVINCAETASRIMFGDEQDSGCSLDPVRLVINLSNKNEQDSISYWLNQYSRVYDFENVNSLRGIKSHLKNGILINAPLRDYDIEKTL